ncbi:expressed unknown protein [Seminavis robusta]|uniref:Uncharacterized protein n=1 Tax=Seminavis robusta TaxID=568900 RepID=A0A9N8HGK8_9STRA|nr:expressed unknown protein [Seminavis robusta]|eukprot:Sro583_g170670.1 n/a (226) ;mRNA; r:37464-38296
MTDHVSAAATLRANNASPLLSSGLSCHVVAEQVLGFLERKDILQCLAVECLKNHFHLEKYYCQEHGSKLESQVGRRQNHIARKEKQQGIADDVITNDTKKFKGECEDCVEEEFGFERCPDCTEFSPKEEVHGGFVNETTALRWVFANSVTELFVLSVAPPFGVKNAPRIWDALIVPWRTLFSAASVITHFALTARTPSFAAAVKNSFVANARSLTIVLGVTSVTA